jgi:hypothetical protein
VFLKLVQGVSKIPEQTIRKKVGKETDTKEQKYIVS